jgi:hypothetical protein
MNVWLFDALDLMKSGRKYHCRVGKHRLELRLSDASSERFPLIELDETNVLLEDWVELPFVETEVSPLGRAETPPGDSSSIPAE